jgi:hypothetical protein
MNLCKWRGWGYLGLVLGCGHAPVVPLNPVHTTTLSPPLPVAPTPQAQAFASIAEQLVKRHPSWTQVTALALPKNELCAAPFPVLANHPSTHRDKEFFHSYVDVGLIQYKSGKALPDNSAIIKRSFNDAAVTTAYFVMQKQLGSNPTGGDWLYATVGVDGKTIRAGALADCAGCHDKQAAQDYLFRAGIAKGQW